MSAGETPEFRHESKVSRMHSYAPLILKNIIPGVVVGRPNLPPKEEESWRGVGEEGGSGPGYG